MIRIAGLVYKHRVCKGYDKCFLLEYQATYSRGYIIHDFQSLFHCICVAPLYSGLEDVLQGT